MDGKRGHERRMLETPKRRRFNELVRGGRRTHDDSALNTAQFASTRFPRTREGRKGAFDSSGEKTRRGNKEILEFDGRDMKRLLRKNGGRDSSGSKKICWNVFKNQAREFCLATGLHGYKYVAQSQRSKIERIIWAIVLFGSLCCAIVLMKIAWDYYASHPTLTVIETTHRGIWNYPFPAVTICNINRISLDLTRSLVEMLSYPSNMSKEFLVQEFRLLLELLDPGVFEHDVTENLTRLQDIIDDNGLTITEVMEKVTKNCSDLLTSCKWNDDSFECDEFFDRILTRDGICCSFNYVSPRDVENSYEYLKMLESISKDRFDPFSSSGEGRVRRVYTLVLFSCSSSKPRKMPACGYQTGLAVTVNPDPEDYFATILGSFGVKVLVHYPYDYPDHNANDKLIGLNRQAFLSVSPEETYAMLDVKDLAISTRNCIFSDEGDEILKDKDVGYRRLTSGRYSYINCMAECRANTIRNKCDCIPYYFPSNGQYIDDVRLRSGESRTRTRTFFDVLIPLSSNVSDARVCDLKDVECLSIYRPWYDTSWPGEGTERTTLEDNVDVVYERPCGCIPDCTLFRYPVDVSQGILDTNVSFDGFRYLRKTGKHEGSQNQSIIHVFFSDLIAIQYRRRVHYNWRNLFASFGGLLGLFVGFSLMSGFEIIYFFIIRIITDRFVNNDRENRNESRSFPSEIQSN
ncbi:hypothetical protein HZH68_014864 [Vespula germanica]|uniref:Sodium channel protein Nach n=1 Tax=Vespula germanica TaxID=30212 RepID=A0A834MSK9_VESGE|nr:hypothetical protein HZH68_014864 [Vespula germanica]